jgi:hypothetical protein
MTHPVVGGGSADCIKNPELFLFNVEFILIPFIQDIPLIIGYSSHGGTGIIEKPVQPTELAGVEMSKLQAFDLFQLVAKGMKLATSVFLCIMPAEGDAREIITHLAFRAWRIC